MTETIRKIETDLLGNTIHLIYEDGVLRERTTYNKKGEMVEVCHPGDLKTCYVYDENGDEVEINQYFLHEDGTEEHAFQGFKKYDEDGRLVEYEYENLDEGYCRFTYKYETMDDKIAQKTYDCNGDLVEVGLIEK